MNDLLERFFELESRQRVMAVVGLLAVVFGGYWYFVYAGRRAETIAVTAKIKDLRTQRESKQKLVANIGELQQTVRDLGAQLKEAEAQLPDSKEIPDLLTSISSAGERERAVPFAPDSMRAISATRSARSRRSTSAKVRPPRTRFVTRCCT